MSDTQHLEALLDKCGQLLAGLAMASYSLAGYVSGTVPPSEQPPCLLTVFDLIAEVDAFLVVDLPVRLDS